MVGGLKGLFPPELTRNLLIGLDDPDDAAVYALGDTAIVFTADYFPPVVDDAETYGAIAANNALSDVFAMGGQPVLALNLAGFPDDMPPEVAQAILRGGARQARDAGAVVAGGHTTASEEPNFGMAVIGTVDPAHLVRKGGARAGDRLVLTKPLGVGVITTAGKAGTALPEAMAAAVGAMLASNRAAAAAARRAGVVCGTDVTGFGLIGHALELAESSGVGMAVHVSAVPLLTGALHHAAAGDFPGGASRNESFFAARTEAGAGVDPLRCRLLFSPETAGGLLLAVPADTVDALVATCRQDGCDATVIGEVTRASGLQLL